MSTLTARAVCPWCGEVVYKEVEPYMDTVVFRCFNRDADSAYPKPTGCKREFVGNIFPKIEVRDIRKVYKDE